MLLHGFIPVSRANGPGRRAVIWFQGCTLKCAGCWNPETHPFGGKPTDDDDGKEVIRRILALQKRGQIEGVTFSGGEPMQQSRALLSLIEKLGQSAIAASLSFGLFTGYTLPELERGQYFTFEHCSEKGDIWRSIRERLDFAVMGRYNQLASSILPLRSSRNQKLQLFTNRYREADFDPQITEIIIGEDGSARITGFPILGIPA